MKRERNSKHFTFRMRPSVHDKFVALSSYYDLSFTDLANKLVDDAYEEMVKRIANNPAAITKERLNV